MMRGLIWSAVLSVAFGQNADAQSFNFGKCRSFLSGLSAQGELRVARRIEQSFDEHVASLSGAPRRMALGQWLKEVESAVDQPLSEQEQARVWDFVKNKLEKPYGRPREKLLEVDALAIVQIHKAVGSKDRRNIIYLADLAFEFTDSTSQEARAGRAQLLAYALSYQVLDRLYWEDKLIHMSSSLLGPNDKSFRQVRTMYVKERFDTVFIATHNKLSQLGFNEDERVQMAVEYFEAFNDLNVLNGTYLSYHQLAEWFELQTPSQLDRIRAKLNSAQMLEYWHRHFSNDFATLELVATQLKKENEQGVVRSERMVGIFRALQGLLHDPRITLVSLNDVMRVIEVAKDSRTLFQINWNNLEQTSGERSPLEFAEFVFLHRAWFSETPPVAFVMRLDPGTRMRFLGQLSLHNVTDYRYLLASEMFDSTEEGEELFYRHLLAFFSAKKVADHRYRGGKFEDLLAKLLKLMEAHGLTDRQRFNLAKVISDSAMLRWYLEKGGAPNMTAEEQREILMHQVRFVCRAVPEYSVNSARYLKLGLSAAQGFVRADHLTRRKLALYFVMEWERVYPHLPKENYFSDKEFADAFLLSPMQGAAIYNGAIKFSNDTSSDFDDDVI